MDRAVEPKILTEAKDFLRHDVAPGMLKHATSIKGLFQVRVLDMQGDAVKVGLCLVDEHNTNHTLKILGKPKWLKVMGKITLHGMSVDMDFNRISDAIK